MSGESEQDHHKQGEGEEGHHDWWASIAVFFATGIIITIVFEIYAVGRLGRWQYGSLMPIIPFIDIGLSPVAQWIISTFVQLWFVKRQLVGSDRENT